MANTTLKDGGNIEITGLDADWFWNVTTDGGLPTEGVPLKAIHFVPSAANDRMIVHDGGIDAVTIFDTGATGTATVSQYFSPPAYKRPVIDISDCTLGTAANAKVFIEY